MEREGEGTAPRQKISGAATDLQLSRTKFDLKHCISILAHTTRSKKYQQGCRQVSAVSTVVYAGVEVSRKEGKKELSVICVEVMV